ncbi:MAG: S1C family serine protease, partial [Candidatus Izemoplasmatales bacterium]|nr:S1C family serine protease [Candidatus Izemoplasmatales bacterium]
DTIDQITSDKTIQAEYVKQTFTIRFYDYLGALIKTENVAYLEEATPPDDPTREHHAFLGWSRDTSSVTKAMDVYPLWHELVLTPEEIFQVAIASTVEVKVYGRWDDAIKLGTGFFISDDGILVTNHHVIESGYSAKVVLANKQEFPVVQVLGYSEKYDLAILKIETNTTPLSIATNPAITGASSYALGSSLGLSGTFSSGIVSSASRIIGGVNYIQTTTPLSSGNSGGPLLNKYGEVIGVNTATFASGQNMNLAVNITELQKVNQSTPTTLPNLYQSYWGYDFYPWDTIVDEIEPNDQISEAQWIEFNGTTINGVLQDAFDIDMYRFDIDTPLLITLLLIPKNASDILAFEITLMDGLGTAIGNHGYGKFDAFEVLYIQMELDATTLESFYISIQATDAFSASSGYDLFIHLG